MDGGRDWQVTARFASWWLEIRIVRLLLDLILDEWNYGLAYYCSICLLVGGGRDWHIAARFDS